MKSITHIINKFDLRRHIQFGARVASAVYEDARFVEWSG